MATVWSETAARNAAIWHSNRNLGIGTASLATRYRLSRQRIKQIVAREDQKRQLALSVLPPSDRFPSFRTRLTEGPPQEQIPSLRERLTEGPPQE